MPTISKAMQELMDTTAHYADALAPIALNGCLTAAGLFPGKIDRTQLLMTVLGFDISEENVNFDTLIRVLDEAILDISEMISLHGYEPMLALDAKSHPNLMQWTEGFSRTVGLNEAEWTQLNEHNLQAGKQYGFLLCLGSPELLEDILGIPADEQDAFIDENRPLVKAIVESLYIHYWEGGDDFLPDEITAEDLPGFDPAALQRLSDDLLMENILDLGDMLPREVIDEAIRRGQAMVPLLRAHLENPANWGPDADPTHWWALLHAIFILGFISGEAATKALLQTIRYMHRYPENDLWDWIAPYWPSLFRNKREAAREGLQRIAADRRLDWYPRICALECLTEAVVAGGPDSLTAWLEEIARMASDQRDELEFRMPAANILLSYPRPQHRPLLEQLAAEQQHDFLAFFSAQDIDYAYELGEDQPEWEQFDDPLEFYDPENILQRQQRWLREEMETDPYEDNLDDLHIPLTPYVRETPKVGRNDPCPCGSGKKYKKCCLKKLH